MSLFKAATGSKIVRVGAVLGITAATLLAVAQQGQAAGAAALTVSPGTGPDAIAVVTLSAAANTFKSGSTLNIDNTTGTIDAAAIQFNAATTCPATEAAPSTTLGAEVYNATNPVVVNTGKLVVKTQVMAGSATGKSYKVCVYDTQATPAVLATGSYKVYLTPTVVSLSPSAGPVYGGNTVTVTGTNFTAKVATAGSVTIGGSALTGVKLVNGTTLTGVVPAHAADVAAAVVVTTEGGASNADKTFAYADGISVSPKTMKTAATEVLDITGQGFNALNTLVFGDGGTYTDANSADPHVYLVEGLEYDDTNATGKTHGQAVECEDVLVISDAELICTVDSTGLAEGAYQVVIVNDGSIDANTANLNFRQTIVSSESTFTIASY